MKKSFFALFFLLSVNVVYCQKPVIEKIGAFKIYDSVKALTDMGLTEIVLKKNSDYFNFHNLKNLNQFVEYDNSNSYSTNKANIKELYLNPNVRSFKIRQLELIPNLILKEVELIYLNDSLISFETSSLYNKASIYLKDYSYENIRKLSSLLCDKYDYKTNRDTIKAETALDKTTNIFKINYKTNNESIKCDYEVRETNNAANVEVNSFYLFKYYDENKIREIKRIESELEKKSDLEKYDTNKL